MTKINHVGIATSNNADLVIVGDARIFFARSQKLRMPIFDIKHAANFLP